LHQPVLVNKSPLSLTKPALLMCYLALRQDWVVRSSLALLLCPDASNDVARHQLRLLLNRAKSLSWAGALEVEPQRVRFVCNTDVAAFKTAIGKAAWKEALSLYHAPLLHDVTTDSPAFEEWLNIERQKLEGAWREAMLVYANQCLQRQDLQSASQTLERLWQHDEFDESILQRHLEVAYLAGRRELALRDFARFEQILKQDFGSQPQPKTLELQRQILAVKPLLVTAHNPQIPLSVLRTPQLVGREREAKQLQQSTAPLVAIIGEAGVGKTRFALELLPHAQVMRCIEGLEHVAYAPLLPYAKQHLETSQNTLGAYFPDLAQLFPEHQQSSSAKPRLLEAWARLFDGLVLLFDDLQWADSATLELILFLAARGTVRLYATIRSEEISKQLMQQLLTMRAERIVLQGLQVAETAAFVSSLIGTTQVYPIFSRFLQERTGGNIFFMLEILKALFEAGALRAETNQWHTALDQLTSDYQELELPERVTEVVLRRTQRLPEQVRHVLGAASVLAEGLRPQVLQELTGFALPDVIDALEQLELAGIVREERFVHDLLRQSVYQNLSQTRKKYWHSQAAKLMQSTPQAAEHYLAAGETQVALPLLLRIANEQRTLGLLSEARATYLRVLRFTPEHYQALAQVALLENQLGLLENAEQNALLILQNTRDFQSCTGAYTVLASLAYGRGDLVSAGQHISHALTLAQHFERSDASLEEIAFDIFEAQERYEECILMLENARVRLTRCPESSDLSIVLSGLAAIYDDIGRSAEALPLHFEALEIARRTKNRYAQVNAAIPLMWALCHVGRAAEAVQIAREALAFGEFSNSEYLRNGLGAALMQLGELEAALEPYLHNAQCGNNTTQALAWGRLAHIYHQLQQPIQRDHAVANALAAAQQTQVPFARLRACIAVLNYGTNEQLEQILPLVRGKRSPDPNSQTELEAALAARGVSLHPSY
ncbi:MAG: BTAD domain-containing putative transcriptional regulator, partial [Deinococcales bacterium]